MKKVIGGKLYNTETAKKLADYESPCFSTDFHYFSESLYQKRTGEFFLAGAGNALSKYSEIYGGESHAGERIVPLTYSQAQQWAEDNLEADEYSKLFGESEDNSKQAVTYSISAAAAQRVKREATKLGISGSEFVERLIMQAADE